MLAPAVVAALLGGALLTSCDDSPSAPLPQATTTGSAQVPSTTPDALRVCEKAGARLARGQAVLSAVIGPLSDADRAQWGAGEPPESAATCTYVAPRPVRATASPGCPTGSGAVSFPSVTFLVDLAAERSQRLPDLPSPDPCAS